MGWGKNEEKQVSDQKYFSMNFVVTIRVKHGHGMAQSRGK